MLESMYCTKNRKREQKERVIQKEHYEKQSAKRINIVSIKMVKEGNILYQSRKVGCPSDAVDIGKKFLEEADREKLVICCLDVKNQPTSISVVSIGSLNSSIVHPREVFKVAILSNAASIIMLHNHPSGNVNPSIDDRQITKRISEAGKILGIELIDHIIIGDKKEFYSFKENMLI